MANLSTSMDHSALLWAHSILKDINKQLLNHIHVLSKLRLESLSNLWLTGSLKGGPGTRNLKIKLNQDPRSSPSKVLNSPISVI